MKEERILLTGGAGRLGTELRRLLPDVIAPSETDMDITRPEHIEAALAAGSGAVLALPHLGGWEYAGAWLAQQGHRILVVVEPVEPRELFEWFVEVREAMGMEVVPLGEDAAARALKALRDNRIVCLVSDRDLTGEGIRVEFNVCGTSTRKFWIE